MVFLKACPKCSGDVTLDRDRYGQYLECLQCGMVRDVDSQPPPRLAGGRLPLPKAA